MISRAARTVSQKLRGGLSTEGQLRVGQAGRHHPPHHLEGRRRVQRPAFFSHALHDRAHGGRPSSVVPPQVRCPVLGVGLRFRTQPDVLVSNGVRIGPLQRRGNHRPPRRRCPSICWPTNIIKPLTARRSTSPRPSPTGAAWERNPPRLAGTDDLKVAYQVFKDEARDIDSRLPSQDRQHRRLERDASGLEDACSRRSSSSCASCTGWLKIRDRAKHLKEVFAELSQRVWEAYHAPDRRCFAQRLRSLRQWAGKTPHGGRPGKRSEPVRQARSLVDCLPPPRRTPHEQHAGPPDARNEPLLRPRPTSARHARRLSVALSCVGVVMELHPLAPGDGAARMKTGGVPPSVSTNIATRSAGSKTS